ncbi:class I SAM-dependent methyltransferase [Verrucomicrobia bacterium]|nr:class I SAM-dependent methyltransferase [Verrucomicrobiota bacterium]
MDKAILSASGGGETVIVFENSQGLEVRATPLRLTRYQASFEVYNPYSILQLSEVLSEFRIYMGDRMVYEGRAVISSLVNTGIVLVCESTLDEAWLDVDLFSPLTSQDRLNTEFSAFIEEWRKIYTVNPEFKVAVADLATLLLDLRRWLEQVELNVRSQPSGSRDQLERDVIHQLRDAIGKEILPAFRNFEKVCSEIDPGNRPAHGNYVKRQIHPVVSCSPFFYRSFRKPLGYAGDYEMVSMMLRDPLEGATLFAKMLNMFFLDTTPVIAHRNRIDYLVANLIKEAQKAFDKGKRIKIFNLGCGPAVEVQRFMQESELSNHADFTLLDFNEETISYSKRTLEEVREKSGRTTGLHFHLRSVHQILKDAVREESEFTGHDYQLVYCAGLFDYLSDRICKRLMDIFYELVAPGGLLLATNVDASNPSRNWMEYVTDWHLVYRTTSALLNLTPDKSDEDYTTVASEDLGVNIFLEIRNP